MSRIGKLPVELPQGVSLKVNGDVVLVEGPKGKLEQQIKPEVTVKVEDNTVIVDRINDSKPAKSYHGLYRNLINNMVIGVSQGYQKTLVINGVGYRAEMSGKNLVLNLGFSSPIEYVVEDGITVTCDGNNKVVIAGIRKDRVGQVAAEIRSIRPPEPYKGKGVRYEDEYIRRKVGKSGVK
jgi:large subunit ribosomal protein L6